MSFLKVMTAISLIITVEGGMPFAASSSGSFGVNSAVEVEPNLLSSLGPSLSISSNFKSFLFPKLKSSRVYSSYVLGFAAP